MGNTKGLDKAIIMLAIILLAPYIAGVGILLLLAGVIWYVF